MMDATNIFKEAFDKQNDAGRNLEEDKKKNRKMM